MSNKIAKLAKNKDKEVQKRISKHLGMFDRIPEFCKICKTAFDKKSKEMAQTWIVNANYDKKRVTLFCPTCWKNLQDNADKIKEKVNARRKPETDQND